MELFSVLASSAVALAGAWVLSRYRERAYLRSWKLAATRLKLGDIVVRPRQGLPGSRLTCISGPLNVRLEPYHQSRNETGTRIVVDGFWQGAEPLTLKSQGVGTRLSGREIEIGDPVFDGEVSLQGSVPLALAVLDAPARERFARLLRGTMAAYPEPLAVKASLIEGVLEVCLRGRGSEDLSEQIYRALQGTLKIAHDLVAPEDIPTRLMANLRSEPLAGVRLSILSVLAREFSLRPETRRALQAALRDRDGGVRLWAAKILGEEGHPTLLELAELAGDAHAAGAIAALGETLPAEKVTFLLQRALAGKHSQTAQACLHTLAERGTPQVEKLLLRALGSSDPQVAVAAAQALGQTGTVAAVAPLRAEASSTLSASLRNAARQAIAAIQSRLTGAAPGQLSLDAGTAAGALSLAAEAGELSLAEPEAPFDSRPTEGESR